MYLSLASQSILLLSFCLFGWSLDLYFFHASKVKVFSILEINSKNRIKNSSYRAQTLAVSVLLIIYSFFFTYLQNNASSVKEKRMFQLYMFAFLVFFILVPSRRLFGNLRSSFLRSVPKSLLTLGRVFNIFAVCKTEFSDVVFSDILTSCSKVFADLANVFYIIYHSLKKSTSPGIEAELKRILGLENDSKSINHIQFQSPLVNPAVTCVPYLIRLKQCINDLICSTPNSIDRRRHLANAIKYFSSLPVIFLSAFQKDYYQSNNYNQDWFLHFLFYTWLFFAIFNSCYSFYWDITFDWGLEQSSDQNPRSDIKDKNDLPVFDTLPSTNNAVVYDGPFLLRKNLAYKYSFIYYLVIVIDFVLRATWTIKLSSHITLDNIPNAGFILGALEVLRRCIWILFRVEKEAC
ncbi:Protein ERD1-like protein [Smittium culicis]|uniref:Protein ERD1-like protein n=1 Tax=Smittium culicis TaxID=133412 RepID=A0A1R1YTK6_9FUNG|nr:Protein ERD1-like protein [Smittium culicis]OMJ30212.1 Protein ERD1-like protein [Smittium culicis]